MLKSVSEDKPFAWMRIPVRRSTDYDQFTYYSQNQTVPFVSENGLPKLALRKNGPQIRGVSHFPHFQHPKQPYPTMTPWPSAKRVVGDTIPGRRTVKAKTKLPRSSAAAAAGRMGAWDGWDGAKCRVDR